MIDEGDCGAIGGMMIGRGNRSTRRTPAPAPLCPPQIPHHQTRARTRAVAVRSQRLTASAMALRNKLIFFYGEELLAPRPTPKLEDHPLSVVRDCLFNIIRSYPPYSRSTT
jgi:hypothetical protein